MRFSAMRLRGLAAAGLVLTMAAFAAAADDDFEFADGLAKRGYPDLARQEFERLLSDPKSSPQKKAEGQYGLATLAHGEAKTEAANRNDKTRKPMDVVLKLFDAADAVVEKFIKDNPTHPRALEAKLARAKVLQDKADYANVCIAEGWLPASTTNEAMRTQVAAWYDTAIGLLEENRQKALKDMRALEEDTPQREDAADNLGVIWLYKFAAMLGKGRALPSGDATGNQILDALAKEYEEEFLWEFSGTVRELWATLFVGQARAHQGQTDAGVKFLRTAASAPSDEETAPLVRDVVFQAYAEIGRVCREAGRKGGVDWAKEAANDFATMQKNWPQFMKFTDGQRAGLSWARLLADTGNTDRAMALVNDAIRNGKGTAVEAEATKVLGALIASGGVDNGDPKLLEKVAKQKFDERDANGAILGYQAVIASCTTPEQMNEFGWRAWERIGDAYALQQRFWEAALAYDVLEQAWRKDKANEVLSTVTNETGYKRAFALNELAVRTKDAADKAAAKKALDDFTVDHPESDRNLGAEERVAEENYKTATRLRSGDPAEYKAALELALASMTKIKPASPAFHLFHMRMADCKARLGKPDEALAEIDKFLAQPATLTDTDARKRAAYAQARGLGLGLSFIIRLDKASSLERSKPDEAKKAYQDLLDHLTKNEKAYKDTVTGAERSIDNWRTEALIGTGQVDKADEMVDRILKENADNPNLPYLMSRIGSALEATAKTFQAKGGDKEFQSYMLRCAKRRMWAIDKGGKRNPDALRAVGGNYADGGDYNAADALFQEAKKLYEDQAATADAADKKRAGELRSLARSCTIELIDLRVRQGKFDEAIPQLEEELVRDPGIRATVVSRLRKDTALSSKDLADLVPKLDANRTLLDKLTSAYMKAPSKERLIACVNLCFIGSYTMKGDLEHTAPFIEFKLRRAECYLALFGYTKAPADAKAAASIIRNEMEIPGYLDSYESTLVGSKDRALKIKQSAEQVAGK